MTDTSKGAVERLLDGVTPGPWRDFMGDICAEDDEKVVAGIGKSCGARSSEYTSVRSHKPEGRANARFIAWARGDKDGTYGVPALLAEREALTAEVARLTAAMDAERAGAEYLVWSHEHGCWWRPNSAGYTNDARAAGTYSRDEAMAISRTGRDGWSEGRKPDELPVRLMDMPDWIIAAHAARREGGVK